MVDTKGQAMENLLKSKEVKTIDSFLRNNIKEIEKAVPAQIKPERIARIAMTAIRLNPKLGQCNPYSFIAAVMIAAQMGLEPNTPLGQCYLIPYGTEVNLQLGYQGILDLCYRSGEYKDIYAFPVWEQDHFKYSYGLDRMLEHEVSLVREGNPVRFYAVYHTSRGGSHFVVWEKQDVERHRDLYSQAYAAFAQKKIKETPWDSNFTAMALKTAIKDLLKFAPKSVELVERLNVDGTSRNEWGTRGSMLDVPALPIPEDIPEGEKTEAEKKEDAELIAATEKAKAAQAAAKKKAAASDNASEKMDIEQ